MAAYADRDAAAEFRGIITVQSEPELAKMRRGSPASIASHRLDGHASKMRSKSVIAANVQRYFNFDDLSQNC